MRLESLKKLKFLSNILPTNFVWNLSSQKTILPYYHTVSDLPKAHYRELEYFRNLNDFKNDLDFFQENFESVEIDKIDDKKKCFHLSFDDGLQENYSVVANLLYERKINATFFINSDFIDNKKIFFRHKISLILSELIISNENRKTLSSFLNVDQNQLFTYIKLLKNEDTIDEIASKIHINFNDYLEKEKPYLSLLELKEMKKMGFTIGNHSRNHARFSELNFAKQKADLQELNSFLLKENLADELYFCFPFGDDSVEKEFFEWMYSEGAILKSFGTAGLKKDHFENHHHRILMEYKLLGASEIIKTEYIYYFLKSFFNKNKIRR